MPILTALAVSLALVPHRSVFVVGLGLYFCSLFWLGFVSSALLLQSRLLGALVGVARLGHHSLAGAAARSRRLTRFC